jgi:hypothetical protein
MIIRDDKGCIYNLKITVGTAEKLQEIGLNLFCIKDAEAFFEKDKSRYAAVIKFLFPDFAPGEDFAKRAETAFDAAWTEFYPEVSKTELEKIKDNKKPETEKIDIRKSLYRYAGEIGINPRDFSAREIHWLAWGAAERNIRLENLVSAFGGNKEPLKNKYNIHDEEPEPGINRHTFELMKGLAKGKTQVIKVPKKKESE